MKYAAIAARALLGLIFVVFGLNYFLKFLEVPPPATKEAGAFMGALFASGYLAVVKVLESAAGSSRTSTAQRPSARPSTPFSRLCSRARPMARSSISKGS